MTAIAALGLAAAGTLAHAQIPTPGSESSSPMANIHMGGSSSTPRAPRERQLQGYVRNADGKAIQGAVIYIRNLRNNDVRSVTADDHGGYRFGNLDRNTDYTLWAQTEKARGPAKTVSSFDSRDAVTLNLTIQ